MPAGTARPRPTDLQRGGGEGAHVRTGCMGRTLTTARQALWDLEALDSIRGIRSGCFVAMSATPPAASEQCFAIRPDSRHSDLSSPFRSSSWSAEYDEPCWTFQLFDTVD